MIVSGMKTDLFRISRHCPTQAAFTNFIATSEKKNNPSKSGRNRQNGPEAM